MTRLDHVNITVNNLDESAAWYFQLFGFTKAESGVTPLGKKWAILACNDSMIAMSEYTKRPASENEDPSFHRMYHFGLRIDDADAWRAKIKSLGIKVAYDGEVEYPNSRSWYVHDPSGHEIEVSWTGGRPIFESL